MNPNDEEFVELEDVFGCDDVPEDVDDDERPVRIWGAARSLWDDLCRRVASIRPSLRAGELYGDGELCGAEWWLSQHRFTQYIAATCLRQPKFLQEHGLVLVAAAPSDGAHWFAVDASHEVLRH